MDEFLAKWNQVGKRFYETGADRGMFYLFENGAYSQGYVFNGLISIDESPSGADPTDLWADNFKYLSIRSAEDFGFTINAYCNPKEFQVCDGKREVRSGVLIRQQTRKMFGFCYRSLVGNDTLFNECGYILHFFYGCTASPSEITRNTISDSPEAVEHSWECTTTPINIGNGSKPTSVIEIDTRLLDKAGMQRLKHLESIIYGHDDKQPRMPLPDEVIRMMTKKIRLMTKDKKYLICQNLDRLCLNAE